MVQIPRGIIERETTGGKRPISPSFVEPRLVSSEATNVQKPRIERTTISAAGQVGESILTAGDVINKIASQELGERQQLKKLEDQAREMGLISRMDIDMRTKLESRLAAAEQSSPLKYGDEAPNILREELSGLEKKIQEQNISVEGQDYLGKQFQRLTASVIPEARAKQTKAYHAFVETETAANIESHKKIAVQTRDPSERASATVAIKGFNAALVSGGIITPETGAARTQKALQEIDITRASMAITQDPGGFLTLDLRNEYPLIADEEIYHTLQGRAVAEAKRFKQETEDRAKRTQAALMDDLSARAIKNELPDSRIDELVVNGWINPKERTELLKLRDDAIKRRTSVVSNPGVLNVLSLKVFEDPEEAKKDVPALVLGGHLSGQDGLQIMESANRFLAAKGSPGHFSNTPKYKEAIRQIKLSLTGGSLMPTLDQGEREANARNELWARVEKGEDPLVVAPEIIKNWKKGRLPETIGGPRYDNVEDLLDARKRGIVPENVYLREIERFKSLNREKEFAEKRPTK